MSLYWRKRKKGDAEAVFWWIDARWHGCPRLQLSTGTKLKSRAREMHQTLRSLRDAGRLDVLALLAAGKLELRQVHAHWLRDRDSLTHLVQTADAPELGPLADEWLEWLRSAGALSPRTHRPYAPLAVDRYESSLNRIFATLPEGRRTRTTALTRGAVLAYREARRKGETTGSTINRDLGALMAFRRWCSEQRGVTLAAFRMPRERENPARERWLDRAEIETLLSVIAPEWKTWVELLLLTGMRVGEALALTWGDVRLADSRISIGAVGRVKSAAALRDVPIGARLATLLVEHARTVPSYSTAAVFPAPLYHYAAARRAFRAACKEGKLERVRMHDLRHTFAVRAAQAGVPIPRLQKLLGHASAAMTMRYAAHAPAAYFAEDAALVEGAMFVAVPDQASATLRSAEGSEKSA